jgi:hypothetical protein
MITPVSGSTPPQKLNPFAAGQHLAPGVMLHKQGGFGSGRPGHDRCPHVIGPVSQRPDWQAAKAGYKSLPARGLACPEKRGIHMRLPSANGSGETFSRSCGCKRFPFQDRYTGPGHQLLTAAGSQPLPRVAIRPDSRSGSIKGSGQAQTGHRVHCPAMRAWRSTFVTLRSHARQKPPRSDQ